MAMLDPNATAVDTSSAQASYLNQQSSFAVVQSMLNAVGLGSLSGTLHDLMIQGITDQNQLNLQLQQTPEWKARFAGNEQLKAQGLPELSVGDYLSAERSYAQIMKQYGLPAGFHDSRADFANFIGKSVSPAELTQRMQAYSDFAMRTTDPLVAQQLRSMGLDQGHILANIVDPDRALPLIQNQVNSVILGAAARRAGTVADTSFLSQLATRGISEQEAQQKFGESALMQPSLNEAANIYGNGEFTNQMAQDVAFNTNAQATQTANRLASQVRGAFSGSAGSSAFSNDTAAGGGF